MKKKSIKERFYPLGKVKKWLLLMKLITFFLVAGFMQVHAAAFAQGEQVAFPEENLTVEQVFSTGREELG